MQHQHNQSSMAAQLANLTNRKSQQHYQHGNKSMKYRQETKQEQSNPVENSPSQIGDKLEFSEQNATNFFDAETVSEEKNTNLNLKTEDYQNNILVESEEDEENASVVESEVEEQVESEESEVEEQVESEKVESANESVEFEKPTSLIVPFASQIDQEITFVVYPEEIGTDSLFPGFFHRNPFSRKGGTLRLMLENLVPTLTSLEEQKILMLGDAKKATAALLPLYNQITEEAFEKLLSFAKDCKEDADFDTVGLPIDDRIFIKDGNVNLTFFSPYPDLQEDIGVKQIDNLAIWLSKLNLKNLKLNLIFAYTVEDLLDSSVNLVLNTLAQNETFDSKVYLAKSNNFDLHPELVKELTSSFDAFVYITK